jgi:hypothetical protein
MSTHKSDRGSVALLLAEAIDDDDDALEARTAPGGSWRGMVKGCGCGERERLERSR